jgi:hypothetical protein
MTSTAIARRQRDAGMVAAAAREHAAEAAERVEALLAAVAPDGELFALDRLQEALGLLLDDTSGALAAADGALVEEERDDVAARERRDRAAGALHERLVCVRAACDSVYGPGAGRRVLGLRARTPRHPKALRLEAWRVIDRLRDAGKPLPAPPMAALAPDPASWAAHLEEPLADLEAALRQVRLDRRARESTLLARRRALRRVDRTQSAVTTLLAGLYRLADLDRYEERLRPRRGRPRRNGVEAAREGARSGVVALMAAAREDASPQERPRAAAGGGLAPRERSEAEANGRSTPRGPSRAVADVPSAELEAPAAAAGGSRAAAPPPATAASTSSGLPGRRLRWLPARAAFPGHRLRRLETRKTFSSPRPRWRVGRTPFPRSRPPLRGRRVSSRSSASVLPRLGGR